MPTAADVIATARSKLGSRYVWGAEGPNAFDCSGLMQWAYGQHGIRLPRVAADQARYGQTVPYGSHQPGDLIFSSWDTNPDVDHVALYIGGGEYIHAPRPGDVVKIGRINSTYQRHITNVQRIPALAAGRAPDAAADAIGGVDMESGGLVDAIRGISAGVRTMAGGATAVGDLAKRAMWLALPTTQVRIVTGVVGVGLVGVGVWILARQAR